MTPVATHAANTDTAADTPAARVVPRAAKQARDSRLVESVLIRCETHFFRLTPQDSEIELFDPAILPSP